METPDANGFVNISWPSKNVPHGGIFHTHIANSTTEQQQFLKVLVEESRLDTKLRNDNAYALRRVDRSPRRNHIHAGAAPALAASAPTVRPHTSRRRSLSAIRQAGLLAEDSYRPLKKGEDREKLKDKLAYTMAYGDTPAQIELKPIVGQRIRKSSEKKLPTEKEKWNELVTQIRERAEWLAEMEFLGEGGAHREIINEQIAERMRALDALGIDSQCSTARSSASGFSTIRSRETNTNLALPGKLASERSNNASNGSIKRGAKKITRAKIIGKGPVIETVAAYNQQMSPLGYSPRRRV